MIEKIKNFSNEFFDEIVSIRRHIHKFPELSFNEYETSSYIKSILTKWHIPFKENIADNGIVVLLKGKNSNAKTIALRADFDALPINELNAVSYKSVNKGIMHACGHDAHTASLLGSLKILNTLKEEWEGAIKFIFQPAEEQFPGGAKQMIKEGVLKSPTVSKVIGQHVFPDLEVGKVGFCPGKYMASADEIEIYIDGGGGHAALPHTYNNPILAASRLILDLDDFFMPFEKYSSVFAIGFVKALGHGNVIPDNVELKGTFRTLCDKFRNEAHQKMREIADDISKQYNVKLNFVIKRGYPSLINNKPLTLSLINYAKDFLGDKNVINLSTRMTAEDFAYFSRNVPSCFYRLGTANIDKGITNGLHTARFNIDEEALKIGMGLMAYLAIKS